VDAEPERGDPAQQVVREGGQQRPGGVGEEDPGWAVAESCALLEVADGELHHGVAAVVGVQLDGAAGAVGDERVVAPVRPQGGLGVDQTGAAHDQPAACLASKRRLGHLGGPAVGVVDVGPGVLADGGDRGLDQLGLAHRDREPDGVAAARGDDLARPESRVAPQRQRPGCPGPADPTGQLVTEPLSPAAGIGRAGAHPKVEQLPGVGPAGQQRVVAKPVGVAVGGPTLGVAVDLAHRGIEVHRQLLGARAGAGGPRSGQEGLGDPVQLADVAEGERAQERAQRRGGHHPMPEDLLGASGPQHVSVVDRVAAGHHRVQQGQHLAAGPVVAGPVAEVDEFVDDCLDIQVFGQGCGQHQAGVGDGVVVIEGDDEGVRGVRRWHRKGALRGGVPGWLATAILPAQGPFS